MLYYNEFGELKKLGHTKKDRRKFYPTALIKLNFQLNILTNNARTIAVGMYVNFIDKYIAISVEATDTQIFNFFISSTLKSIRNESSFLISFGVSLHAVPVSLGL